MKHTDELIKEIFSNKLGEYESHVSPELWGNIASQLPQAAATTTASTTAVVAKTISAKLIWTAAIVAVTVASVVTYLAVKNEDTTPSTSAQKAEQTIAAPSSATTETDTDSGKETTDNAAANIVDSKTENTSSAKQVASQKTASSLNETKAVGKANEQIPHSYPMADIFSEPQESVVSASTNTNNKTETNSTTAPSSSTSVESVSKQELTAKFTTAAVNKEELRYFFMPEVADAQSYLWDFGGGHTSGEVSPMHAFDEEGIATIRLTVVDKAGNKKEYTQNLGVFEPSKIEVPNIFTPNGDGQNDYFDVIEKSKNTEIQKIIVFSTTDKVFESDGDRLWDGSDLQGNPLPAGEYKYIIMGIDKEGNKVDKKGFVTLKR